MEHRPDIAAGWVAPADCSKWNIKEEIRVGSKPPFNEKTSKPNKQAFSCGLAISNGPDFNRASKCLILRQVGSVR